MATSETTSPAADLTPFVPRVVVEWLREAPDARHRELEGTLAFVDISGFTAMSERLAELGKRGAEEVLVTMNRVFALLLDVGYASGGGLLKFGGDALLLFFNGPDHAGRACDAAYGMRRALTDLGPLETSAGPVTLKMHVGIHSDSYGFFLVGESHRELLVSGPGVTRTVQMEGGAEAGEILVSEETAATLPDELFGARRTAAACSSRRRRSAARSRPCRPSKAWTSAPACRSRFAGISRAARASRSTARRPSGSSTSAASTRCSPSRARKRRPPSWRSSS